MKLVCIYCPQPHVLATVCPMCQAEAEPSDIGHQLFRCTVCDSLFYENNGHMQGVKCDAARQRDANPEGGVSHRVLAPPPARRGLDYADKVALLCVILGAILVALHALGVF